MSLEILNRTKGSVVCSHGCMADTALLRLVGLLSRTMLEPGTGLLIKPSSGVHTFGMRFPIDIISLNKDNRVLGAWANIGPWKIRGLGFRTCSVLELPAGRIEDCSIEVGDELVITPFATSQVVESLV